MMNAKNVKIHGMKDERWTIRDKLHQYRGILKLYAREKKLQVINAGRIKKKVSRDLKILTKDVQNYREIIHDSIDGNKRRLRTILQHHRDYQLAFQNMPPDDAYEAIYQRNDVNRRQLDKLYYLKKKKMKEFFDLKLECALLRDKYEREKEYIPDYGHQQLTNQYQHSMAKQSAAAAIRRTYENILTILKKDAKYFNAVLDALVEDRKSQCKVLIKVTEMGQLATENLDDTRTRYKNLERDVRVNMKERERTLNIVRFQVDDLWAYLQSLVRTESEMNLNELTDNEANSENDLQREIKDLEKVFENIKESMLVRSYEEIFPRFEEQMRQKSRLITQFNHNIRDRDGFLNKKYHATLILATLEHSMISTTAQYKAEKKKMLEELEAQRKREIDMKNMRKVRGELLMNIRAALQNMNEMLTCVQSKSMKSKGQKGDAVEEKKEKVSEEQQREAQEQSDETADEPQMVKTETNGLALLSQVSHKVAMISGAGGPELDKDRKERAKDMYQTYISEYKSKLKYGKEPEITGFFVEHEVIDTSVLSRTDVKLRSRQIVEANLKPE
ncbi:myosin-9-like isoform X1 [Athalia rosae]|uniref:myosin-9-like isoform X1 n=2 Tax=Athalia rosae TaxID=37344 RepID=UPI002033A792|nr:myosin-9-like isoform X1 [Athalia rosae]